LNVTNRKILVVDDEQQVRVDLFHSLSRQDLTVSVAENGRMALEMLARQPVDLLVTDIKMPEMDGLELLKQAKMICPAVPVIIMTGFATVDSAIHAMRLGAFDYILKPFPMEVMLETVARALASGQLLQSSNDGALAISVAAHRQVKGQRVIIGQDPIWLKVVNKAKAVASSTATVLILGESGTGKEVLARLLHEESERSGGPFVALNCAALPDGLLESELFGHEKGAFTGAITAKKGKFELADGGTLLLDEIGEVPIHLQAKLLRVLQEGEVDRLGGKAPVKFDVHVLATTNRNLSEAVEQGSFRQDLFYRLNVIPLRLPSLKERRDDILLLADYFIGRYTTQYKKSLKALSHRSRQRFLDYVWPGNVREMENMIERAVLLSRGMDIEPWDLWDEEEAPEDPTILDDGLTPATNVSDPANFADDNGQMVPLKEVERQMIRQALQQTDNNRTHAAKILGISVRTLRNKLNEYRNQGLPLSL
jgi:two-component system response regulator FlrC